MKAGDGRRSGFSHEGEEISTDIAMSARGKRREVLF